ncbi:MAG: dienelactone hydrolase family protein [Dehalococcoidia bacterium]|nr:dienelactone hydrolase family protein [Dehalococcoidia bacterium]
MPGIPATAIAIAVDSGFVHGDLALPPGAPGIVVFAHGSGSSRFSSRNRYVAEVLQAGGLGTLLFDLLTPDEERIDARTADFRFDIELLTRRLVAVTAWLREQPATARTPIGYFGASTGAAAALQAAAELPAEVTAVVSRGGRPDLAGAALGRVRAPVLLIVGGQDHEVLQLNQWAYDRLACEKELAVVPGATHLFEEPGTLERAAELVRGWFERYMGGGAPGSE